MIALSVVRSIVFLSSLCVLAEAGVAKADAPKRVVSMNVCTDQLAMLIAGEGQLISISHLALSPDTSVMHQEAAAGGYVVNAGRAEQIFALEPDLVLAGAFGGRAATAMLQRLGVRVEIFTPAQTFADIRVNIERIGALLDREARATALIAEMDDALALSPAASEHSPRAAAYIENGYSVGEGALLHDAMRRGGWRNAGAEYGVVGLGRLPLEVLVNDPPDALVAGERGSTGAALATEVLAHPALKSMARRALKVRLVDAATVCGGPFTAQSARRFAEALTIFDRRARQ